MDHFNINRRQFLYSASASLAVSMLGLDGLDVVLSGKARKVGVIGVGWYGKNDVYRLIQVANVEVTAICDVDTIHLDEAAKVISERQKSRKTPRKYKDYRKLLANEALDIVIIGTPDHWHALQTIAALKAGAHVYVQKPTSVDIMESEAMLSAARKYNKVVQVGTQRRSTPHLIEAKNKIIEAGLLGKIGHVEICCYYGMRGTERYEVQQVPDHFDYEMWTGPAPMRPFDGLPHRRWRKFMEYSNGIVGDMCVHMLDTVRWMLKLGYPRRVRSTGGTFVQQSGSPNITDSQTAIFEFDGMNCVWQHRTWGRSADKDYPWSLIIYGEKGTLKADVYKYEFIPKGKGETIRGDTLYEKEKFPEDVSEKDIDLHCASATRRHMIDFLAAIDGGKRPVADIEEGHISTVSCIAANLSLDLDGKVLIYDPVKKKFVKAKAANKLLCRDYRKPWKHPK